MPEDAVLRKAGLLVTSIHYTVYILKIWKITKFPTYSFFLSNLIGNVTLTTLIRNGSKTSFSYAFLKRQGFSLILRFFLHWRMKWVSTLTRCPFVCVRAGGCLCVRVSRYVPQFRAYDLEIGRVDSLNTRNSLHRGVANVLKTIL